jgi:GlpG protein
LRQIGTLPGTADPQTFGDHLLSLGITSRAVRSPDGWAIWVHNEDEFTRAKEELARYQDDPDAPRFHAAGERAEEVRRESARRDRAYRKNVRDLSGTGTPFRLDASGRPLTVLLAAACAGLYLAGEFNTGLRVQLLDRLLFASFKVWAGHPDLEGGLADIRRGEVWRLITPIFLHAGPAHVIFNTWAMWVEGSLIERRRGTITFFALVLLSALASNVGQYLYSAAVAVDGHPAPWLGISGVAYALFGYLWMKGRHEPEQGMILHPRSVRVMLIWLMLGFLGFMNMANGCHVVGLVVGMLFGLARF